MRSGLGWLGVGMVDDLLGTDYEWDGHGHRPRVLCETVMGSEYRFYLFCSSLWSTWTDIMARNAVVATKISVGVGYLRSPPPSRLDLVRHVSQSHHLRRSQLLPESSG